MDLDVFVVSEVGGSDCTIGVVVLVMVVLC